MCPEESFALDREQSFKRRWGINLLMHACHSMLSIFSLFLILLFFFPFTLSQCLLNCDFLLEVTITMILPLRLCTARVLYIMPVMIGFYHFRLCLVAVKRFPKNTYFPEMLISGKGKYFHVFGCILKIFSENIFWCLVFGKEEGKHKSENTSHNPEKKNHQRRDRDLAFFARSHLGLELAISDWSWSSRLGLDLLLSRARTRSLSLSLSLSFSGNALKGK